MSVAKFRQIAGNLSLVIVNAATTGAITLSGAQTVDGASLTAGMLCLVKNTPTGGSATDIGVYTVKSGGSPAWVKYTPAQPNLVIVLLGTLSKSTLYYLSATNVYTGLGGFYV
jgi:hypothetical protein